MMKNTLGVMLVLLTTMIFSTVVYSSNEEIVASLDDEKISVEMLATYVQDVAGDKYESWLRDKEGLRKLADFYINRIILLEYARKTVNKKDVMYLTTLLKVEVQDKVNVSPEDVDAYMKKNQIDSEKQARQEIESELKNKLMVALVENVRTGHEIKYF